MKKALITGGAGFIGSHLAEYLLSQNWAVTSLDDLSTGHLKNLETAQKNSNFRFVKGTILDSELVDKEVAAADQVYHLAAVVGVELVMKEPVRLVEVNTEGTSHVLKSCVRHKKKCFLASTSEVYGKSSKIPYAEGDDTTLGPTVNYRWAYACSKQLDEFYFLAHVKQSGLKGVVGRFFNTVGPRQSGSYGMVIPRLVNQALKGQEITVYGTGEQTRCFGHVYDVIQAVFDLMQREDLNGEIFNLGGLEEVSVNQLAKIVLESAKSSSKIKHIPYAEAFGPGFEDTLRRKPDITKVQKAIRYNPQKSLRQIVEDICAYAKS